MRELGGRTNRMKRDAAVEALSPYYENMEGEHSEEEEMIELLTDLAHYCGDSAAFRRRVEMAIMHYEAETK